MQFFCYDAHAPPLANPPKAAGGGQLAVGLFTLAAKYDVGVSSRRLVVVALLAVACAARGSAAAQERARGTWRAAGDCFIRSFILGDQGAALVTFSSGTSERGARWVWREEGLTIVSNRRGVLLTNGHFEDAMLVADVDYSTTDDIDFRTCRFGR